MSRTISDRVEILETSLLTVRTSVSSTKDELAELKANYTSLVKQLEQRLEYVHNALSDKPPRK